MNSASENTSTRLRTREAEFAGDAELRRQLRQGRAIAHRRSVAKISLRDTCCCSPSRMTRPGMVGQAMCVEGSAGPRQRRLKAPFADLAPGTDDVRSGFQPSSHVPRRTAKPIANPGGQRGVRFGPVASGGTEDFQVAAWCRRWTVMVAFADLMSVTLERSTLHGLFQLSRRAALRRGC